MLQLLVFLRAGFAHLLQLGKGVWGIAHLSGQDTPKGFATDLHPSQIAESMLQLFLVDVAVSCFVRRIPVAVTRCLDDVFNPGRCIKGILSDEILNTYVSVPCMDEQISIAKVIMDLSNDIYKAIEILQNYTLLKQGMMQQLLSGNSRS